MGFFDNLRDRFRGNDDDYYDDDYYDDEGYADDDADDDADRGTGVLGNTPRPEAESVSVYTRSGRPVTTNAGGSSSYEGQSADAGGYSSSYRRDEGARASRTASTSDDGARTRMNASGQLPAYVLHASSYEDVQTVVRRVRTNQPVVLVLGDIDGAVATRILDFCYGLSFGIDGTIEQLAGRTFAVVPKGLEISQAERDKLAADGDLEA